MAQALESKRITITSKRQITLPKKFYDQLGFNTDVECILKEDGIFLRPLRVGPTDFSEEILADLIAQGFSGEKLLKEFKHQTAKLRPAVLSLIAEADTLAQSPNGSKTIEEIFSLTPKEIENN